MQLSQAAVVAFLAATATAAPNVTWVTTTVTGYVTYCPESTTFEIGTQTYTATESQWVTVTECPQSCTITWQPTATASPTLCPGTVVPVWNGTVPTTAPVPTGNSTYNMPDNPSSNSGNAGSGSNSGNTGSGSGSSNAPPEIAGAATKLDSSAALIAAVGAVAYFL